MTVDLADIRPYANGSRATLRFGNATSAALTGLKATVDWGTVDAKGSPNNDEAKSKEITFISHSDQGHGLLSILFWTEYRRQVWDLCDSVK